jgi:hypothetical protein
MSSNQQDPAVKPVETVTYAERIRTARTAYLSIPTHLKPEQARILADACLVFPHLKIGNYESNFSQRKFDTWGEWHQAFKDHITDCDLLIVACDSERLITKGVRGEIDVARRMGKTAVIFKADDRERRRYWGYEVEGNNGGRLLKRAEGIARADRRRSEAAK